VTTALRFLVRNWPLKLAAVLLATLLYSGLVLSQSTQTFAGSIPITVLNEASDVVLLTNVGNVDTIRYVAPPTVRADSSRFEATVDLAGLEPREEPYSLPVDVRAIDPRIAVLSVEPARVDVILARVTAKEVEVVVQPGVVPAGLLIAQPVADPAVVEVRGAEPDIDRVVAVEARIQVEPSGLDVDRDTDLVPVDSRGEEVLGVNLNPATARVSIDVFTDTDSRTLLVNPNITGTPALDFDIASVVVTPRVVTVSGDAQQLAALAAIDTRPIQVGGRRENVRATVPLQLPEGVTSLTPEVQVTITLREVVETATFAAGIVLEGTRTDRTYHLSADRVLVTVSGSPAELANLADGSLVVRADVSAFDPGVHEVTVEPSLPDDLAVVSLNPETVLVTVALPQGASPANSPTPSP
jgi:YbbR domain-containing protein